MKRFALLALMVAAPSLAAAQSVPPPPVVNPVVNNVVREFIHNSVAGDWFLDGGWTWAEGSLTHWPGPVGLAQQATMPALTQGKTYRINVVFTGHTKGSVSIGLGKWSSGGYGPNGYYTLFATAAGSNATLVLTPTADYDGSVAIRSVVELGDEVADQTAWTVPDGWSRAGGVFMHVPGMQASLVGTAALVPGRTYQLTFNVVSPSGSLPDGKLGTVSLEGKQIGWFGHHGAFNFSFDFLGAGDQLAFNPEDDAAAGAPFNGGIRNISVREITSDPPDVAVTQVSRTAP